MADITQWCLFLLAFMCSCTVIHADDYCVTDPSSDFLDPPTIKYCERGCCGNSPRQYCCPAKTGVGLIVGIVIGSIGVCILMALSVCCFCCRGGDSHNRVVHQANTPSVSVVNATRLVVSQKCTIGKTIDPHSNSPTYHTVPCRYGCCGSFPNQDCCNRLSTGGLSGAIVGGIIGFSFIVGICCQCVRHRRRTVSRRPVRYNNDFAVVTTDTSGDHPSYDVTQPPGVQYVRSPYTGQTYRPDQATSYS